MESGVPAGKTRYPRKTQTAISYQHLDRDFITASRQDAATRRSCHHARANTLPKIATGRSVRSAKKLWEDYECIEVRSRVQTENEKQPEVPPLRVPKNPHSLYKHPVKPVKPFHILHSPSDYGEAKHRLRELYAQVTYLTNAVRNCDGSASYKGMCKRQRSYRSDNNNPLRLHWRSSDETIPIPRLLLPVTPGTNTKWYSWKVDTPREEVSPRGRGEHQGRGNHKRDTASAPAITRSLDFLERYSKKEGTEGRQSKTSKDLDTKSRDGHLSIRTVGGTEFTESLASSSLSSIVKYDLGKFKLKEHEVIAGKAVFMTQPEPRKMSSVREVQADVAGASCHGDGEEKGEEAKRVRSTSDDVREGKDEGCAGAVQEQTPEDEMDAVARANAAATEPTKTAATDKPQNTQSTLVMSEGHSQDTEVTEQVAMGTSNESGETCLDNSHGKDESGNATNEEMPEGKENASVTTATDEIASNNKACEENEQIGDADNQNQDGENAADNEVEESPDTVAAEEDTEQKENCSEDASEETVLKEKSENDDT